MDVWTKTFDYLCNFFRQKIDILKALCTFTVKAGEPENKTSDKALRLSITCHFFHWTDVLFLVTTSPTAGHPAAGFKIQAEGAFLTEIIRDI